MKVKKTLAVAAFLCTLLLLTPAWAMDEVAGFPGGAGPEDETLLEEASGLGEPAGAPAGAFSLRVPFLEDDLLIAGEDVRYSARPKGAHLFVTRDGKLVYLFPERAPAAKRTGLGAEGAGPRVALVREGFSGASVREIKGDGLVPGINRFRGVGESIEKTTLNAYGLLDLGEIYEGVELKLRASGENVEKVFVVGPEADVGKIRVWLDGVEGLGVNGDGELEVSTGIGSVKFTRPLAYQETDGGRRYVDAAYEVQDGGYSFSVGDYDRTIPLVIDPLLSSTFFGGGGQDEPYAIAADGLGGVYVSGITNSFLYNTVYEAESLGKIFSSDYDVFVAKFDERLENLLAIALVGGTGGEKAYGLSIDRNGDVYLAGGTDSNDFPTTPCAYDRSENGGLDVFVIKLDSGLQGLLASTLLGGVKGDKAYAMALDGSGNVYIAGRTFSGGSFPRSPLAYDMTYGGYGDAFVSKLDPELGSLLASTLLGGSGEERARAVSLDASGNVYVAGWTYSYDFPSTPDAFDGSFNGYSDAFVARFDPELTALVASTFLGGRRYDRIDSMLLDGAGNLYVGGGTSSWDFPTTAGAYDTAHGGGYDGFISKLGPYLRDLKASTFIGGSGFDRIRSMSADPGHGLYVAGLTSSADFPALSVSFDTTLDGTYDVFVSRLNGKLTGLVSSTLIGGSGNEAYCESFHVHTAVGPEGVYLTGATNSPDFPATEGSYNPALNGAFDSFVSYFDWDL